MNPSLPSVPPTPYGKSDYEMCPIDEDAEEYISKTKGDGQRLSVSRDLGYHARNHTRIQKLVRANPTSGNEILMHVTDLYEAGLYYPASSCAMELVSKLNASNPDAEKVRNHLAIMVGQCGLALNNRSLIIYGLQNARTVQAKNLLALALNDDLNNQMRFMLMKAAPDAEEAHAQSGRASSLPPIIVESKIHVLINAGGPKLTRQLWSNLHSLYRALDDPSFSSSSSPSDSRVKITIVHASEWSTAQMRTFTDVFPGLSFYDLCVQHPTYSATGRAQNLRGFQIKLACISAIPYIVSPDTLNVLMTDADILWITTPKNVIARLRDTKTEMGVFRDIWYESKPHSQSCGSRFILGSHGCRTAKGYECESGVVAIAAAEPASLHGIAAACGHLAKYHSYYFTYAFGDKDLYGLAAAAAGRSFRRIGALPAMLGHIRRVEASAVEAGGGNQEGEEEVVLDAMLHSLESGVFTHVHTTLFPIESADWAERNMPTHFTNAIDAIHFVTQDNKQTIGVDAALMRVLPPDVAGVLKSAKGDNSLYPNQIS